MEVCISVHRFVPPQYSHSMYGIVPGLKHVNLCHVNGKVDPSNRDGQKTPRSFYWSQVYAWCENDLFF